LEPFYDKDQFLMAEVYEGELNNHSKIYISTIVLIVYLLMRHVGNKTTTLANLYSNEILKHVAMGPSCNIQCKKWYIVAREVK
jgi:hypothetical protein